MSKVKGGKNVYGYKIGIIMLESQFPRIPGEMGNACTFDFPVLYKVVKGASPKKVVTQLQDSDLSAFIQAAKELEAEGVSAITTNCGFLAMFHDKIASQVNIPVFTSSLMMIPLVYKMLGTGKIVGVMTVNKSTLSNKHLAGAGALDIPKVIYGLETEEEFTNSILQNRIEIDVAQCRKEHIKIAKQMVEENPNVGAIVLECTNMPPYAKDIQSVTGLPVFDIVNLVNFVYGSLVQSDTNGYL